MINARVFRASVKHPSLRGRASKALRSRKIRKNNVCKRSRKIRLFFFSCARGEHSGPSYANVFSSRDNGSSLPPRVLFFSLTSFTAICKNTYEHVRICKNTKKYVLRNHEKSLVEALNSTLDPVSHCPLPK